MPKGIAFFFLGVPEYGMTLELQSGHKMVIPDMLPRVCAPLNDTQPANLEQAVTVHVNQTDAFMCCITRHMG